MYRIGHAWDTHRLVENRPLILGGIQLNSPVGLLGHSDADVVLHAVAEAFLGSLALGDLGTYFPDTDEKYKNYDSKDILNVCYKKVVDAGYILENLDLTIYAQSVKISPFRLLIRESIASILNVNLDQISVKATTWEKMGFVGRDEAIAAECVVLIRKNQNIVIKL